MCGKIKPLNLIRYYIILFLLQHLINVIKHKNPEPIWNGDLIIYKTYNKQIFYIYSNTIYLITLFILSDIESL